jgi:hypothetical protein
MKTRVTLLFIILSLLATPTFAADFKKGVGSSRFKDTYNRDHRLLDPAMIKRLKR